MAGAGIEVAGHRRAVLVGLLDQREELRRLDPLRLEASGAARRPLVDVLADLLWRFTAACQPGRAEPKYGPELRMRAPICSPRSIRRRARHHAFGIDFAGRKRRGHAVGEKHDRVDGVLVHASLTEEIDRVVRVQIEQARQHVVGVSAA